MGWEIYWYFRSFHFDGSRTRWVHGEINRINWVSDCVAEDFSNNLLQLLLILIKGFYGANAVQRNADLWIWKALEPILLRWAENTYIGETFYANVTLEAVVTDTGDEARSQSRYAGLVVWRFHFTGFLPKRFNLQNWHSVTIQRYCLHVHRIRLLVLVTNGFLHHLTYHFTGICFSTLTEYVA